MRGEYHPSSRARWAEGQPISLLMSRALDNPHLISLAAGFVDNATLPVEPMQQALQRLTADESAMRVSLQYGSTAGHAPLRTAVLEQARQMDGFDHPPAIDQVVITAGSNQLLHLVSESLLDAGDVVLCAAPTYFVYLGLLSGLGARAVGVASDELGIIPAALEEALRRFDHAGQLARVKAIYLVPYYDNPAGVTMPMDRRAEVVQIAKKWSTHEKIHVLSDEAYRQLRYAGDDIPSPRVADDEGDTVIVAGTFSKSFAPGVRVGWGILPKHLVGPVLDQKGNVDFGSPNFNQMLMHQAVELGLLEPHLEQIRDGYRKKLRAMLDAAEQFLAPLADVHWHRPSGGLYVWVRLPERIDTGLEGALFDAALRNGVFYVPGEYCYASEGEPVHRNTMRLSFGVQSCEKIHEGIEKLADAIAEVAQ